MTLWKNDPQMSGHNDSCGVSQSDIWSPYCDAKAKNDIQRVKSCSTERWTGVSKDSHLWQCCMKVEHLCVQFLIGQTKCRQPTDMKAMKEKQKQTLKRTVDSECGRYKYSAKDCKQLHSSAKESAAGGLCKEYLPCFRRYKELLSKGLANFQAVDETKPDIVPEPNPEGVAPNPEGNKPPGDGPNPGGEGPKPGGEVPKPGGEGPKPGGEVPKPVTEPAKAAKSHSIVGHVCSDVLIFGSLLALVLHFN
ncbi:unnamed protein product [Medioppia subpectinata]|uniref:Uncharacterized protein n=1 Tax=Medioppia subpectinata TaxID=1979941 RepID=A0A7R9PXX1_9ACAR|nr:unnamed protein product [Medioppia subpectinata]CAG2104827.1 unnamed protein product [Medioppia subpectinata]